jgi:Major Facilitator Superfamily
MEMIKRGLSLLKQKSDFRNLMGAQFFAQAGDGIVQTAIGAAIVFGGQKGFDLESAQNPQDLLRIALTIFIPYTILSPFLGVVIDRWDRRRLLIVANGFRAIVIALVALMGISENPSSPLLLVSFLLTLASTRVVLATKAAAIPTTLEGDHLVEANAVSQLGGALFQLGGAGVALIAKGIVDVEPIALAGAVVYGLGAVFAAFVRHPGETREKSTLAREIARVVNNIVAGFREVGRTPKAGAAITTYFWLRFLWSFSLVGIGFVARELLADDDLAIAAVVGGAGALGAVLGFVSASPLRQRVQTTARLVMGASFVAGSAVAVLGGALQTDGIVAKASLAGLAFFLGFGFFLAKISLDTMVQEALGDDFRGRAFSIYDIAYNLAWVLAAGIMKLAWSSDVQGVLIAGMGVVFLIGLLGIGAWFRSAGLLRSRPQVAAGEA